MISKRARTPWNRRRILRTSLVAGAGLLLLGPGMTACRTGGDAAPSATSTVDDYVGKWNIRIIDAEDTFAAGQIDVEKKGDELAAGLVWRWGSYGPAAKAWVEDGVLNLTRKVEAEEGEEEGEDVFEARLVDGTLKGQARYPDGKVHHFEGRRAPELATTGEPEWGEPVALFDGETLTGWSLRDPKAKMGWAVVDSDLAVVEPKGNADLVSEKTFQDMKLHIEFNVDPHSNSGVYLRGRYEIQIVDDPETATEEHGSGALYSRIAPSTDATKPAGEWQVFDITLVGRELEVVLNGSTVVDGIVEGITGGAINPFEDEPGPLMLQGDHGKVRFRNVVVTPAQ
ncbi:MAG: DUF1080 domain-containing protein [Acidobacteria bacterium]|nr:DUF1080 domain-containing protein [Acidobacteriota bacterium]